MLVTVLGEIPNQKEALGELFAALKPGAILSSVEVVFDPCFKTRGSVCRLALEAGFREVAVLGNRIASIVDFLKPVT